MRGPGSRGATLAGACLAILPTILGGCSSRTTGRPFAYDPDPVNYDPYGTYAYPRSRQRDPLPETNLTRRGDPVGPAEPGFDPGPRRPPPPEASPPAPVPAAGPDKCSRYAIIISQCQTLTQGIADRTQSRAEYRQCVLNKSGATDIDAPKGCL